MNQLMIIRPPISPSSCEISRRLPVPVLKIPKRYGRFSIHPQDVIDAARQVAMTYGITSFVPSGRGERGNQLRRSNLAVLIRWAVISVLLERCDGITTVRIGELIGRDHSTVVHSKQRMALSPSCVEPYRTQILEAMACARVID